MSSGHIPDNGFNSQAKMELFYDTRQALGASTLVLQGGAAFSMCHLGVVKALHLRGLLPRIITGTSTGALVAALVGCSLNEDLLDVLKGRSIDMAAFERSRLRQKSNSGQRRIPPGFFPTIWRRLKRFLTSGHFFDIRVIEQCAKDNLGDITFEEAFARTGRTLNITVAMPEDVGIPQLLNYVTAPNVLIWSAVSASVATAKRMYAPVQLQCKDETGVIRPHATMQPSTARRGSLPTRQARLQEAPLKRIGELFNVNHFIVSQARPYVVPFIRAQQYTNQFSLTGKLLRIAAAEAFHWMNMLNSVGWLPKSLCRMLMDETIPNSNRWAKLQITPDLSFADYLRLFDTPTRETLDDWILRGERSVWPLVCDLYVRCGIEVELEKAYEQVRHRAVNRRS